MNHQDDLQALNARLLEHIDAVSDNLRRATNLSPVCIATLMPGGWDLMASLASLSGQQRDNPLPTVYINKDFLHFARQISRDVTAGYFDGLLILGIDLCQARALAKLTNSDILFLSRKWPGEIFKYISVVNREWPKTYAPSVVPHFAASLLAA